MLTLNWAFLILSISLFSSHNRLEPFTLRAISCRKRGTLRTQIDIVYHVSSQSLLDFILCYQCATYFLKNYSYIWCIRKIYQSGYFTPLPSIWNRVPYQSIYLIISKYIKDETSFFPGSEQSKMFSTCILD